MMPLIQAPPAFAEHALRCLATMAQTYLENVEHLITLGVLQQLLGAQGHLGETLKLPVARRYAARVLMQCTASKDAQLGELLLGGTATGNSKTPGNGLSIFTVKKVSGGHSLSVFGR